MGYMENLLHDLRTKWGIADEETLAFIKSELIRSFKNGLMRGREPREAGRNPQPRRGQKSQEAVR